VSALELIDKSRRLYCLAWAMAVAVTPLLWVIGQW
jgi:hypothetical protein